MFKTFLNPTDIYVIFDDLKSLSLSKSKKLKLIMGMEEDSDIDIAIFGEDVKEYAMRRNVLRDNIRKLYFVIWGQCSKPMRIQLIEI